VSEYPRGSEWRIWDLHVHTPDSIEHNYTGADKWDQFLSELAALPPDIKVLGINDYWFLTGYERVLDEFKAGRLPNLEAVFPVLEVRCDTFTGTEGHLSRLNLHMICDPLLSVEQIDGQLRPLMQAKYQLTDSQAPQVWSQTVTPESLLELGEQIIASAPEALRSTYGGPLETGFANLNVSFSKMLTGIAENSAIKDHVLLAIGKVEWSQIKWNKASAAHKKTFINSVDSVFTAAPTRDAFKKSLKALKDAEVNSRLLDCSDAHNWTSSTAANRLGQSLTWINADPTFKGLRQALQEYDHRVCIDERPPVPTRKARSPQSVIDEVSLGPDGTAVVDPLFNTTILLNPGFVAVIGNKGQGKSALLDSIALAANSDRQADFSFLTPGRFRSSSGAGVASRYRVSLDWGNGQTTSALMDADFDRSLPVLVDYLPQSLIEKVCSADPDSVEKRDFEAEIERVVFRHIDDETRGSATSLGHLLATQGHAHQESMVEGRAAIAVAANELSSLNLRKEILEALGLESRETELNRRIADLDDELAEIASALASGGSAEQQSQAAELERVKAEREAVAQAIQGVLSTEQAIDAEIAEVARIEAELAESLTRSIERATELAERIGRAVEDLLRVDMESSLVTVWRTGKTSERDALQQSRAVSGGLNDQLAVADRKVAEHARVLLDAGEEAQGLLQKQSDLQAQRLRVIGDSAEADTLLGVQALRQEEASIPELIEQATSGLRLAFEQVHGALMAVMDLQRSAYGPATTFVNANDLAKSVDLTFDVEFRVRGFVDRWVPMVNRQRLGSFYDLHRSDKDKSILAGVDLADSQAVWESLNVIVDRLGREQGAADGSKRSLAMVMRSASSPEDLLNAIYGLDWLQSQYIIRSEGSELSELSPGQRGLVLLLFYLLVDKSERPLLLDQPEENLDNQTVRNVLVPALREAVARRQVIAVTHNPNFAIVGDADQIVVAELDGQFTYRSGSLAAANVGSSAIDVLEGTRAAFTSRQFKYSEVVGS
jgi:ABC-type lipoprotein export system ATPase subunit